MLKLIVNPIILAILTLLSVSGALRAEPVDIVSPTQNLSVVAASGAADQAAAVDLCDYLTRITGRPTALGQGSANATLTIHVGPDDFALAHAPELKTLTGDGFVMKQVTEAGRHHLILAGIRWESSWWAVERFLQEYGGVRWLFPDPQYGEVVPRKASIAVDSTLNKVSEPDYLGRSNCGTYLFDKTRTHLRLGPNGLEFGGHAIQHMFNGDDYAAHPEWFAYFDGKRQWWSYGNGWQICLTNDATVDHAVAYINDFFKKNPDAPLVSVGQNDGSGWCQCPLCTAFRKQETVSPRYTTGEEWWLWVNKVAERVAKVYPDKKLEAIAYEDSAEPPRFKLNDNISVTVTIYVPAHIDLAKRWQAKVKAVNLYSYPWGAYCFGFRHYPHAMQEMLKWGHDDLGAVGHVAEMGGDWPVNGPKYAYIQALQWDVNTDIDAFMRGYCRDSYGPAQEPMLAFWNKLEAIYERRKGEDIRLIFYAYPEWKDAVGAAAGEEFRTYKIEDVAILDKLIAESARRAAKSAADAFRVDRVADSWRFYRTLLLSKLKFADRQSQVIAEAHSSPKIALALAKELASLRSQREFYRTRLRTFPDINPNMVFYGYWDGVSAATVFSDESYLLDECCSSLTGKLGSREAGRFWRSIGNTNPLYESAQTQLYMLKNPKMDNTLQNGSFETGDLTGWELQSDGVDQVDIPIGLATKGEKAPIGIASEPGHQGQSVAYLSGRGTATLSQKIKVIPGERYHFSAWGRYLTPVPEKAVPLEATVKFLSRGKALFTEPTRALARTTEMAAGWFQLQSAVTIPAPADTAVVTLKRNFNAGTGTVLWDDASFQKVKDGPRFENGTLRDSFEKASFNETWHEAVFGASGKMPVISKGSLAFGGETAASLISFGSFDNLLQPEGQGPYRLRIHVIPAGPENEAMSLDWGIMTGAGPISTQDSGLYWTNEFASGMKAGSWTLYSHGRQDGRAVSSEVFHGGAPGRRQKSVWFTFYMGAQTVKVFAGDKENVRGALLGEYRHGVTDITSRGSVYLKLLGRNVKVDQISLQQVKPASEKDAL